MKKIHCLFLVFLLSATLHAQTQFYVSPAGDDAAAGSLVHPWKTITHALDNASPGCTIFLMGGTYPGDIDITVSGTVMHPVVLTNYNGEHAVISGSASTGNALLHIGNAAYITVSNLEFSGYAMNGATAISIDGTAHDITIVHNTFHDIYFSADPAAVITSASRAVPVSVAGNTTTALGRIIISNNSIYNCRTGKAAAITSSGNIDGLTISMNRIHDTGNTGICISGYTGTCADANSDFPRNTGIRWNSAWNLNNAGTNGYGIFIDGASDCIAENNTLYNDNYGIVAGCSVAGKTSSGVIIRSNMVYDNLSGGIRVGETDYPSSAGKIMNATINNNTVANNFLGNGQTAELLISYCEQVRFHSNIIYSSGNNDLLVNAPVCPGLSFDFNLYYSSVSPLFRFNASDYTTLSSWSAASGNDMRSIFANPQFPGIASNNFNISASSPVIDAGDSSYIASPGETDIDTMTRVQNGRVDIGADEYGTAVGIQLQSQHDAPQLKYNRISGDLTVAFYQPATKNSTVSIASVDGRTVLTAALAKGETTVLFNIQSLPAGTYIVYDEALKSAGAKFVK